MAYVYIYEIDTSTIDRYVLYSKFLHSIGLEGTTIACVGSKSNTPMPK